MKRTKTKLVSSIVTLLVCFAMLVGSTFAWFTDSASTGINRIQAGNLDVELYHESKNVSEEKVTTSTENLFKDIELWEPGAYSYETFTVRNEGNLALKYKMGINVVSFTSYYNHNLMEVLKVKVVDHAPTSRPAYTDGVPLKDWSYGDGATDTRLYPVSDSNDPSKPSEKKFTVVVYWEPTDHDDDFNMNNGRPNPLSIDLGIELVATQLDSEFDSFDNQYDNITENQLTPVIPVENAMASAQVAENGSATLTAMVAPATVGREETTVEFEEGALTTGKEAKLSVNTTNTLFDIKANDDVQVASVDLNLLVDEVPVSSFNNKYATVTTYISKGLSNVKVTYKDPESDNVEDIQVDTYDPDTGKLVFKTTHFSVYGVTGRAVAYNLDADKGYAPVASNGNGEPTQDDIKNAYNQAAQDAVSGKVTLTPDADYVKAEEAALDNNAGFELPKDIQTDINPEKWIATIDTRHFVNLESAVIAAVDGNTIKLEKDITTSKQLTIDKSIVLDGANHSITSNEFVMTGDSDKYMIVCTSGATVKNLSLIGDGNNFGLQFYTAENGKAENLKLDNFKLGLCVNASTVTAEGTISQSNIGWGNVINVGYGDGIASGTECTFDFANATFEGVDTVYSDSGDMSRASANEAEITYLIPTSWKETTVDGAKYATLAAARIEDTYYSTLKEALATSQSGDTVIMLKDFNNLDYANAVTLSLKNGVTLYGDEHTISGNVSLYMASKASEESTVTNVIFKDIHNNTVVDQSTCEWYGWESKIGNKTAIYAESLAGTANIINCTFDSMDWEAIQISGSVKSTAVVNITGNVFKHTNQEMENQLRYVHFQSSGYPSPTLNITDNIFYLTDHLDSKPITTLGIWYAYGSNINLTGNYFEYDPNEQKVDTNAEVPGGTKNLFPARSTENSETDDLTPVVYVGSIAYLSSESAPAAYDYRTDEVYSTLQEAIDATVVGTEKYLYLVKDNQEDFTIPEGKKIKIHSQSYILEGNIKNNGEFNYYWGNNSEGTAVITNNGTLLLDCDAASGNTVLNNGILRIKSGKTYNMNNIVNSETGDIVISGGYFTTKPLDDYLPSDYTKFIEKDGLYTVGKIDDSEALEKGFIARYSTSTSSNRTYYRTLTDGYNDKQTTLHLLADYNENVDLDKAYHLYCDEYTFTGSFNTNNHISTLYNGTAIFDNLQCSEFTAGSSSNTANITIKDGHLTKLIVGYNSTVIVEDGTYDALSMKSKDDKCGSLTIKGGTFGFDPTNYVDVNNYNISTDGNTWTVTAIQLVD